MTIATSQQIPPEAATSPWSGFMTGLWQKEIASFSASLGNVERVDVLPFHQMGRFKWKELKLNYTLSDVQPASMEAVESACAQFRSEGLKVF